LHITDAIATQKDLLLGFGGHPMAAGMALAKENFSAFRKGLGKAVEKQLGSIVREEPRLQVDAWLHLDEINLELATVLEMLAPFGAGNPSLTLATRNVKMKSVTAIGKEREHLKLRVEDESGNLADILWWGGAGEEQPEEGSVFDIAYSLRASTFRGEKQVSLQFEEFRVVKEPPLDLRKRQIEVVDYRLESASLLADLREQAPELQIWAEGTDKDKGKTRYQLQPASELVIYSAPPSSQDLHLALEIVKPAKVYLFAVSPQQEKTDVFLSRLAGLAKFVINQREGNVAVQELAGVAGQREKAVRIGLEWLAAGGHISVEDRNETILLSKGKGESNPYLQKELFIAVRGILEETAAYRAHFMRASSESLFDLASY
jgi:single-stranded-DNA-specific exonuclease